tara:strand:+ start:239 stop:1435 length:1197 start_codon:yes stop_codon:yes gene_type:complete
MTKFIKDPVYDDFLKFSKSELEFIDIPEFKRLKKIKQLGALDEVFPSANHSRFSHSLGVAHLSEKFINTLCTNSNISYFNIGNIKIAGLYHDLGHGPFSHVFDNHVITKLCPNHLYSKHENRSLNILENIVKKYNFLYSNLTAYDIDSIKSMIKPNNDEKIKYYNQIVNNKINSLDTDKIDYLIRDSFYLGNKISFDYRKLFNKTKILYSDNFSDYQIYYNEKDIDNIFDIFYSRYKLHREIYNHKTVKSIELMIGDILLKSNDIYNYPSILDKDEFLDFDDTILTNLRYVSEKEVSNRCKFLLDRIDKRDLYKEIYTTNTYDMSYTKNYIIDKYPDSNLEDYHFCLMNYNLCNGNNSPIKNVNFYKNDNEIINVDNIYIRKLIPRDFNETVIKVFKK